LSSIETYQERLRGELAAVEGEIKDRNQQIEALTKRIESLKRALELFASDQAAIAELLRTSGQAPNGADGILEESDPPAEKVSAAKTARPTAMRKAKAPSAASSKPARQLGVRAQKAARKHLDEIRAANQSGKVKRPDLIAAVLQNTPGLTNQEILAALKKEFGWDCKESNLTGQLYTHPERFTHTPRDRSGKNPSRWSVK
jgi:chromosome segregation ATPase